jgi:lipopolysaccharide export system protein LptA
MERAFFALAAGIGLAAMVAISPAAGQESALRGHNSDAPVDFAADRIEVQDRTDRAILSGNVVVRQAQLTLNSARLNIAYTDARAIKVQRIDASGGVVVRSPTETVRGQFAIYDFGQRIITVLGNVTLTRGDSNVNGGRLVLELDTGRAVMDGGGAPGGPAGSRNPGGRVTGTFVVTPRNK